MGTEAPTFEDLMKQWRVVSEQLLTAMMKRGVDAKKARAGHFVREFALLKHSSIRCLDLFEAMMNSRG